MQHMRKEGWGEPKKMDEMLASRQRSIYYSARDWRVIRKSGVTEDSDGLVGGMEQSQK